MSNLGPATRRPHKRCAYVDCGGWFRPKQRYATAKYCSPDCAIADRPRASFVQAGRKGGSARARQFQPQVDAALEQRLAAMTPRQIWQAGRRAQRAATHNALTAAKRQGFHDGFEAAMKALRPRRSA